MSPFTEKIPSPWDFSTATTPLSPTKRKSPAEANDENESPAKRRRNHQQEQQPSPSKARSPTFISPCFPPTPVTPGPAPPREISPRFTSLEPPPKPAEAAAAYASAHGNFVDWEVGWNPVGGAAIWESESDDSDVTIKLEEAEEDLIGLWEWPEWPGEVGVEERGVPVGEPKILGLDVDEGEGEGGDENGGEGEREKEKDDDDDGAYEGDDEDSEFGHCGTCTILCF